MKRIFIALLLLAVAPAWAGSCDLKQSTAVTLKMGPFVDSTDGITAETALTLSQADFRVSKNGGNFAQKNESSSATHDELGVYDVDLDTTDTNTLGLIRIDVQETGAAPVWIECSVVKGSWYDVIYGSADLLTSKDTGLLLGPTTAATLSTQTSFTLTDGETNDDAYNGKWLCADGGGESGCAQILDYTGSTKTITLVAALPFTFAVSTDNVRIYGWPTPAAITADINTTGVTITADGITAASIATDAIGADEIADDAIGASEIADDAITATKIATDAIGALEIANSAIGADEIATNAITATEIAADAIGASEIAADAIGASEIATNAITAAEIGPDAIAASELAASAVDEIWDEPLTEPTAVFAWTDSFREAIEYIAALQRNEINQTSTTKTLRNDADSGDITTCAVSDDGTTFTRAECQ